MACGAWLIAAKRPLGNGGSRRATTLCYEGVAAILDEARDRVARTVNMAMVQAYWMAGRDTVEVELRGKERAAYCARSAPLFAALAVRCVRPRRSAAPALPR